MKNIKIKASGINYDKYFSRKVFNIFNITILTFFTIIGAIPIINVLCMSFSNNIAVSAGEVFLWPKGVTLQAYKFILQNQSFYHALSISIIKTVLGVLITMVCTILVGFPLSKTDKEFRARKFFVWFFMIIMLFNGGLIPWFMMIKYTGLYNSIWALIIPGAVQVFFILLFMNFLRGIPKEIEESAIMDGAGHFTILVKILLPLTKPVLATIFLFIFVQHWNNWFDGYVLMNRQEKYPLMTYLYTVLSVPDVQHMTPDEMKQFFSVSQRSIKAAEIFISTIPIFLVYPFLQKYFTKGLVLGSVKG